MSIFRKARKIAAVLMAAAVVVSSSAVNVSATTVTTAQKDKNSVFYFEENGGNATIVNNGTLTGELTIPATVTKADDTELSVTGIDWRIVEDNSDVTGISIPASVTEIKSIFWGGNNEKLGKIEVDGSNTAYCAEGNILDNKDKTKLLKAACTVTEVTMPGTVTEIGSRAFYRSRISSITIPDSVTTIGQYAFERCKNLTSLHIPASVTTITGDTCTPAACSGVTEITVAAENTAYKSVDGVLFSKDGTHLIQYPMQKNAEEYVIPDGVTKISFVAFSWDYPMVPKLKKITFPVSITKMDGRVLSSFGAVIDGLSGGPTYDGAVIEYKGTKEQWKAINFNAGDYNRPTGISPYNNINCSDGTIFDFSVFPETGEKNTAEKVSAGIKVEAPEGAFSTDVTLKREGAALTDTRFDIDISFVKADGAKVQPAKPVTVKIPVPESMQSAREIFVYHTDDSGKMTKVEAATETVGGKKYVVFTASSFSVYTLSSTAVAEAEDSNNSNSNVPNIRPVAPETASQTAAPETAAQSAAETSAAADATAAADNAGSDDKNQATGAAIAVIPAILAAAAVAISKKNK